MLFTIQAYLEDYISHRTYQDTDGYAVSLANLYFHQRKSCSDDILLRRIGRIGTVFFKNNNIADRPAFEKSLLTHLDKRFKKKLLLLDIRGFPGGVESERRKWQKLKRRKVHSLVLDFKNAIEARAIDTFWISRKQGKPRKRPEKIAQSLFAVFAMGVIGQTGCLLREVASGIGYVDVGVIFSRTLHLIEMKVLRDALVGPDQLEQYMQKEKRREGFLVLVDTIPPYKKKILPTTIKTPSGLIRVVVVDANPTPPSRK